MKWDNSGIDVTHDEAIDWVDWFTLGMERDGMPKPNSAMVGQIIRDFLASGNAYKSAGRKCKACQGHGHSNLIKLGSKGPAQCTECRGKGYIPEVA